MAHEDLQKNRKMNPFSAMTYIEYEEDNPLPPAIPMKEVLNDYP
jgi:hypothetical protein